MSASTGDGLVSACSAVSRTAYFSLRHTGSSSGAARRGALVCLATRGERGARSVGPICARELRKVGQCVRACHTRIGAQARTRQKERKKMITRTNIYRYTLT